MDTKDSDNTTTDVVKSGLKNQARKLKLDSKFLSFREQRNFHRNRAREKGNPIRSGKRERERIHQKYK